MNFILSFMDNYNNYSTYIIIFIFFCLFLNEKIGYYDSQSDPTLRSVKPLHQSYIRSLLHCILLLEIVTCNLGIVVINCRDKNWDYRCEHREHMHCSHVQVGSCLIALSMPVVDKV